MTQPIPGKLVDGVFQRILGGALPEQLIEALKSAGLDVLQPSPPQVSRDVWDKAIELTANQLFEGDALAQRKLGRHLLDTLVARNVLKGPWLSMARLLGPKRALKQAAERSEHYSPVSLSLVDLGGKAVEVHAGDARQTDFLAGLLEGLVWALGGREVQVRVARATPDDVAYSVAWR